MKLSKLIHIGVSVREPQKFRRDPNGIQNLPFIDNYLYKEHTNRNCTFPGATMKKTVLLLIIMCCAVTVFGGFKAKRIKTKKPSQFHCRATISGVTYAADLLLERKDQEKYFHAEFTPPNLIAVRLAVFNDGKEEIVLPLNDLRLMTTEGMEFTRVDPEELVQAVLEEDPIIVRENPGGPVVGIGSVSHPRYDPNDPRNRGDYPPYDYPPGNYPSSGPFGGPEIVLNPGGGGGIDSIENERKLAAVDFSNKAHTSDPILRNLSRDRFLYFSIPEKPSTKEGIALILPVSKGIPKEVVLKF